MPVQTDPARITMADRTLNINNNVLSREDTRIQLENKQSQLLAFLASRPGENLTKSELLQQVWHKRVVTEDVLYVCIAHLRKALGDNARNPSYIKTIPGVGYKLLEHPDKNPAASSEKATEQAFNQTANQSKEITPSSRQPLQGQTHTPCLKTAAGFFPLKRSQALFGRYWLC
ncbi:winged helix-turn-helix domain-containing protein [Thalassomonas haliotis]|uniref:Winged helix-turn-helix domain-containing protein n=1 Tax=Thalassomonas haliotis TaxID=485448 RepID=A0ABY7VA94_9GAMM|nr:winged helix-turn-helix domain-containing protein [Thalassomonas haliotis]WDE09822.1 winged helix-turn-helix domain-containing protein [Thalassomonas haliotis]